MGKPMIRNVNLDSAFGFTVSNFKLGDMVRIPDSETEIGKVYMIRKIKKIRRGGNLYLLESFDEDVLRLYYEDDESILEKIS